MPILKVFLADLAMLMSTQQSLTSIVKEMNSLKKVTIQILS